MCRFGGLLVFVVGCELWGCIYVRVVGLGCGCLYFLVLWFGGLLVVWCGV